MKTSTIAVLFLAASMSAIGETPGEAMAPARQNALVRTYCVSCHGNTAKQGGLSLETFDAAHPDRAVAGMMVSKLQGGAMGASGVPEPDKSTREAFIGALAEEAVDATRESGGWTLKSFNDAGKRPFVTADLAGEAGSRLTLTCRKTSDAGTEGPDTQPAAMQLTITPAAARAEYSVDGSSIRLAARTNAEGFAMAIPLPARELAVHPSSGTTGGATQTFSFTGLSPTVREVLSTCVASNVTAGAHN